MSRVLVVARMLGVGIVWLTTTHRWSVRGRSALAGALWDGRMMPGVTFWLGSVPAVMRVRAGHLVTARQT